MNGAAPRHRQLARQLAKAGVQPEAGADAASLGRLLERVNQAYLEFDQERYLTERSQDLASQEMGALNQALSENRARLASLLSLSSDWLWEQDAAGRFTWVSDDLDRRTGVRPEALLGRACGEGPLRLEPGAAAELAQRLGENAVFRDIGFEVDAAHAGDGRVRHLRISGEPVREGTRHLGWRGVGRDVTATVLAEQRVLELARYDELTGLPNRRLFTEELARALARAQRSGEAIAVMFIDLDQFKQVNDNLGHAAGDELLCTVAQRLRAQLRHMDLLARLGGDEFVALVEGTAEAAHLSRTAHRLLHAAAEPVALAGTAVQVSASIGIALFPSDANDADALMRHADTAMYEAKRAGRNTCAFFVAELAQRAARRFALESDLRLALGRDELLMHYQPLVDAASGELVGLEALMRWQHPQRGLVPPMDFIGLAEETGLIGALGRRGLEIVCRQIAAWRAQGLRPPPCALNISPRQLADEHLLDDVRSVLAEHGLAPDALSIEVTESSLMADPRRAAALLAQLDAMGVRVAVDDFGTGYSSLASLKRLAPRAIKIDRSFVRGLPADTDDLAITGAVVALGRHLGMRVVAEGVETEAQRDCLLQLGCDQLQGYLFGRPMPATELARRLSPREQPALERSC